LSRFRRRRRRHGSVSHVFGNVAGFRGYNNLCPLIDDAAASWINLTRVCSSLKTCDSCLHTSLGCVHCSRQGASTTASSPNSSPDETLEDVLDDFDVRAAAKRQSCAHQQCPATLGDAAGSEATDTNELQVTITNANPYSI
jgi:hypothetical protein